ncbi:sulfur carrier protein ThiS [Helicobacter sp. MIT 14-3879]|uniref:sulfur carrier protein ThiS n=1 Tax=Helicobacter sp. MIT 14-3879 TaxID=2040649 RepID=UPI000E1EF403|nr:sulfur carrier protein ThiS [Helicobacter sp. MIT 14-3879]RDU61704.1 thiamine biosynthesis protein ThiS [Helicobacter sp. MIT 14-3879]
MNLIINGNTMAFNEKINIKDILNKLEIEDKIFAITLNSTLVKKEEYNNTFPNNGDRIEFLQFMGGG